MAEIKALSSKDLIAIVARKNGLTRADAKAMFDTVFSEIVNSITDDCAVAINGFGKFTPVTQAARKCRNPRTGEPIAAPEKRTVKWKPSKTFLNSLVSTEHQGSTGK